MAEINFSLQNASIWSQNQYNFILFPSHVFSTVGALVVITVQGVSPTPSITQSNILLILHKATPLAF